MNCCSNRREGSERISALIARIITRRAPRVEFTEEEVRQARLAFSSEELSLLRERGRLTDDFEMFLAMQWLADGLELEEAAGEEYVRRLFQNARKFNAKWFYDNPYIREISVPQRRRGAYLLTNASYERGEFFQYDVPELSEDMVVLRLGRFDGPVEFPSIYEGRIPWMSVCPSEILSMDEPVRQASGRVLALGLGLGYYPFMISRKETVEEIVVVERETEVISLFKEYLLPQFSHREKISIVQADAFDYLRRLEPGSGFDFCFADLWENEIDGAELYGALRAQERRLSDVQFAYWIEDAIRWRSQGEK